MKANFENFNAKLTSFVSDEANFKPCHKIGVDMIALPKWSEMGAFSYIMKFSVMTAENPNGQDYPFAEFQPVVRIIENKLLFADARRTAGKRADSYAWRFSDIEKLVKKGKTKPIGIMSAEGLINLSKVLSSLEDDYDREQLAGMFASFNKDMLLVSTPAEERFFIRVTQDIIDNVFPYVIDEWQEYSLDENGDAEVTDIQVGDAIIVTFKADGTATGYRVDHDMFEATYTY